MGAPGLQATLREVRLGPAFLCSPGLGRQGWTQEEQGEGRGLCWDWGSASTASGASAGSGLLEPGQGAEQRQGWGTDHGADPGALPSVLAGLAGSN